MILKPKCVPMLGMKAETGKIMLRLTRRGRERGMRKIGLALARPRTAVAMKVSTAPISWFFGGRAKASHNRSDWPKKSLGIAHWQELLAHTHPSPRVICRAQPLAPVYSAVANAHNELRPSARGKFLGYVRAVLERRNRCSRRSRSSRKDCTMHSTSSIQLSLIHI